MRIVAIAAGWAWAAGIVWVSLTPSPPQVDLVHGDKFGHLGAYALLMFWFCQLYFTRNARIAYGLVFLAMGVGLEFAQGALGYRSAEVLDMAANAAGVLAGWAGALVLPKVRLS